MRYRENDGTINTEELINYIEDVHNKNLRQSLNDANGLLYTILRVHGGHHRELYELYRIFGRLKADLEQHMVKEEILLFPNIDEAEEGHKAISEVAQELLSDHQSIREVLSEIRRVTEVYKVPDDVCATFEKTFIQLKHIDEDIQEYIETEQNDLLKDL